MARLLPRSATGRTLLVVGVVLVVTAALAGVVLLRPGGTALDRAVTLAPPTTERLSWVDWAAVRDGLGTDVDAASSPDAVEEFLGRAYEQDATATSALALSGPTMQRAFGFSPASIDWEAYLQSREGALLVLGAADLDLDRAGQRLERSGFEAPAEADGTWAGGFDTLARLGGEVTPQLAYVALLRDEGLVLASDDPDYLEESVAATTGAGEADGFATGMPDVEDTVAALEEDGAPPMAASVLTGPNACQALSFDENSPGLADEAEQRIEDAGGVAPLRAYGIALLPSGAGRVALGFGGDDEARGDADARAALASGPAVGQGGDFAERFDLARTSATGSVVTLDLEPTPRSRLLTDLGSGAVLFAAC